MRKKELKEAYKQMKTQMGLLIIRSNFSNKYYLEASQNINATMNGARFRLNANSHLYKELQRDWNQYGESSFTIELLEELEYGEDESKTDYKEDLTVLEEMWLEKLTQEGLESYKIS